MRSRTENGRAACDRRPAASSADAHRAQDEADRPGPVEPSRRSQPSRSAKPTSTPIRDGPRLQRDVEALPAGAVILGAESEACGAEHAAANLEVPVVGNRHPGAQRAPSAPPLDRSGRARPPGGARAPTKIESFRGRGSAIPAGTERVSEMSSLTRPARRCDRLGEMQERRHGPAPGELVPTVAETGAKHAVDSVDERELDREQEQRQCDRERGPGECEQGQDPEARDHEVPLGRPGQCVDRAWRGLVERLERREAPGTAVDTCTAEPGRLREGAAVDLAGPASRARQRRHRSGHFRSSSALGSPRSLAAGAGSRARSRAACARPSPPG